MASPSPDVSTCSRLHPRAVRVRRTNRHLPPRRAVHTRCNTPSRVTARRGVATAPDRESTVVSLPQPVAVRARTSNRSRPLACATNAMSGVPSRVRASVGYLSYRSTGEIVSTSLSALSAVARASGRRTAATVPSSRKATAAYRRARDRCGTSRDTADSNWAAGGCVIGGMYPVWREPPSRHDDVAQGSFVPLRNGIVSSAPMVRCSAGAMCVSTPYTIAVRSISR